MNPPDILTRGLKTAQEIKETLSKTYDEELRKALEHIDYTLTESDTFGFPYHFGQVFNIPRLFRGRFRDDVKASLIRRGFHNVKIWDEGNGFKCSYAL
jgi:hypothetical protein